MPISKEFYKIINESEFNGVFANEQELENTILFNPEEFYKTINESKDFGGVFANVEELMKTAEIKKKEFSEPPPFNAINTLSESLRNGVNKNGQILPDGISQTSQSESQSVSPSGQEIPKVNLSPEERIATGNKPTEIPTVVTDQAKQEKELLRQHRESVKDELTNKIITEPNNPEPNFHLGNMAIEDENFDEAKNNFEQVIQKNPQAFQGFFGLGRLYSQKGENYDKDKSLAFYQEALKRNPSNLSKINPSNISILNNIAILKKDDNKEEALGYMNEAIKNAVKIGKNPSVYYLNKFVISGDEKDKELSDYWATKGKSPEMAKGITDLIGQATKDLVDLAFAPATMSYGMLKSGIEEYGKVSSNFEKALEGKTVQDKDGFKTLGLAVLGANIKALKGTVDVGFGGLTALPASWAFDYAIKGAEKIMPEDLQAGLFSPFSSNMQAKYQAMGKEPPEILKDGNALLDLGVFVLLMKGTHKGQEIAKKVFEKKPITKDESVIFTSEVKNVFTRDNIDKVQQIISSLPPDTPHENIPDLIEKKMQFDNLDETIRGLGKAFPKKVEEYKAQQLKLQAEMEKLSEPTPTGQSALEGAYEPTDEGTGLPQEFDVLKPKAAQETKEITPEVPIEKKGGEVIIPAVAENEGSANKELSPSEKEELNNLKEDKEAGFEIDEKRYEELKNKNERPVSETPEKPQEKEMEIKTEPNLKIEAEEIPLFDSRGKQVFGKDITYRGEGGNHEAIGISNWGTGLYTTGSVEKAAGYAHDRGGQGRVVAYRGAKPKNPIKFESEELANDWVKNTAKNNGVSEIEFRKNLSTYLLNLGYDGVNIKKVGVNYYVKFKPKSLLKEQPQPPQSEPLTGGNTLSEVEKTYNKRKKQIDDKLEQDLEDNKDLLDDIADKGGNKTVRQKIYQEHTNATVELEKWKMGEDLKSEKTKNVTKDAIDEMVDFADNNLGKDNEVHPATGRKLFELNKERLNNAVSGLRDKIANGTLRQVTRAIQTVREVLNVSFNINNRELGKKTEQKIDDIGIQDAKKRTDNELLDHITELEKVKRNNDSYVSHVDTRGDKQYSMGNDNFDPYLTEAVNRGLIEIKDGKLTKSESQPLPSDKSVEPLSEPKPKEEKNLNLQQNENKPEHIAVQQDNPIVEPNIKVVEGKAENPKGVSDEELQKANEEADQQLQQSGARTGRLKTSDLKVVPEIMQYKATEEAGGINRSEKLEGKYKENLAGTIGVWIDKNNELGLGKNASIVVDGHHRVEFAKRNNIEEQNVFYIDAPNAKAARLEGAFINMSQGRGTAIDAAKIYREATPEQVKDFKPKSTVAKQGQQLAKLNDDLFNLVATGKLDINKAVGISEVTDKGKQTQLYQMIKKVEQMGRQMTPAGIKELANEANNPSAPKEKIIENSLFGVNEKEELLLAEKANLIGNIKSELSKDAKILSSANKNKDVLENAGNQISVEQNQKLADEAKLAGGLFDTFKNTKEVQEILNRGTEELKKASRNDKPKVEKKIIADVKEEIKNQLDKNIPEPTTEVKPTAEEKITEEQRRKNLADKIRSKKIGGKNQLYSSIDFGLSESIYNKALDLVANEVERKTKLGNAINKAIQWVDSVIEKGKKWNKGLFAKHLNDRFKVTFQGKEVEVQRMDDKQTAEMINGFYSPLEQRILDTKLEKTTGKEWAKKIGATEESKWTGLDDFLKENADKSLTKKDIHDYFKNNRVQIVEVVKGYEAGYTKDNLTAEQTASGNWDVKYQNDVLIKTVSKNEAKSANEAIQNVVDEYADEPVDNTKFSNYQQSGDKTNYREVLITMPTNRQKATVVEVNGKWKIKHADGSLSFANFLSKEWAEKGLKEYIKNEQDGERTDATTFKSSHFDEPNILAHLRISNRVDAEGNKVLHISEIQSDWGQKGKKEGFDGTPQEKYDVEVKRLYDKYLVDSKFVYNIDDFKRFVLYDDKPILKEFGLTDSEIAKLQNIEKNRIKGGVPSAPFVTNTTDWVKLALKTALQQAVKDGVSKITWESGEVQNERYDLSKSVERVRYGGENKTLMAYDKNGNAVIVQDNVSPEKLADYIGKDVAEKLLQQEVADKLIIDKNEGKNGKWGVRFVDEKRFDKKGQWHSFYDTKAEAEKGLQDAIDKYQYRELKGQELKIGGKGMIGFYGSPTEGKVGIVGEVAKSLVKELTGKEGKIGETKIVISTKWVAEGDGYKEVFQSKDEMLKWKKEVEENQGHPLVNIKIEEIKGNGRSTQHSIEITPELKKSVEEGMPLFGEAKNIQALKDKVTQAGEALKNIITPEHLRGKDIHKAGIDADYLIDLAVNAIHKAIDEWRRKKLGVKLKEAIDDVIEKIKKHSRFKNLSDTEKNTFESKLRKKMGEVEESGEEKNIETFAETPTLSGSKVLPIQFPELVQLTKELLGKAPFLKNFPSARGMFYGDGKIGLNRNLFKEGNEQQAAKTLAHEIGHAADWMPDKRLDRGNIIGRIYSLTKFLKETFNKNTGTSLDMGKIRNQAIKEVLQQKGKKLSEYSKDKSLRDSLKEDINKRRFELIDQSGSLRNAVVAKELRDFSEYWRPYDKSTATDSYIKYRNSAEEMYADAISGILNSPGLVEQKAPIFYKEFFENINRKPEFEQSYNELQNIITSPEEIQKMRLKNIKDNFRVADELLQKALEEKANRKKLGAFTRFQQAVVSKNIPFFKKIKKDTSVKFELTPYQKIVNEIERLQFGDNFIDTFMRKTLLGINDKLKGSKLDKDDFGAALLADRIISERKDIANPGGHNTVTAEELKSHMSSEWTNEQKNTILEATKNFHDLVFNKMEEAYKAGVFGKEQYDNIIVPNKDSYSTFTPVNYIAEHISGGIKQAKGSLDFTGNPFTQTVLKTASLIRWTNRNRAVNAVREGLTTLAKGTDEIFDSVPIKDGSGTTIAFKKRDGYKTVEYMKEGKLAGIDVKPEVAQIFDSDMPIDGLTALVSKYNKVFRPAVTSLNLGFALYNNPIKDKWKAITNLPAIIRSSDGNKSPLNIVAVPLQFIKNDYKKFIDSKKQARGETTDFTESVLENAGMAQHIFGDFDPHAETPIENIYKKSGLVRNEAEKKSAMDRFLKPVVSVLDAIKYVGSVGEVSTKLSGYQTLLDYGFSPEAAGYYTRKIVGTPNFLDKGTLTPISNQWMPFSNVILQGLRSDINLATSKHTAGAYWTQQSVKLIPSVLIGSAAVGLFGNTIKQLFDDIPEYDKTNYFCIPYGRTKDGKVLYQRIPIDEIGRFFHAVTYKGITYAAGQGKAIQQIGALGEGFTPSLTPLISITSGISGYYLGGVNPQDAFYGENVLTDDEAEVGGTAAAKKLFLWAGKKSGFSWGMSLLEFDKKTDTWTEYAIKNTPVLSRALKISNQGEADFYREIKNKIEKENAEDKLRRKDVVDNIASKVEGEYSLEKYNLATQQMKNILFPDGLKNNEDENKFNATKKMLKTSMVKGINSPLTNIIHAVIYAQSNKEKEEMLLHYKSKVGEEKYNEAISFMRMEAIPGIPSLSSELKRKYDDLLESDTDIEQYKKEHPQEAQNIRWYIMNKPSINIVENINKTISEIGTPNEQKTVSDELIKIEKHIKQNKNYKLSEDIKKLYKKYVEQIEGVEKEQKRAEREFEFLKD